MIFMVLLLPPIMASLEISELNDYYFTGDVVEITYTYTNDFTERKGFIIIEDLPMHYTDYVEGINMPFWKYIELEPGESITETSQSFTVSPDLLSGTYYYNITVFSSNGEIVDTAILNFNIFNDILVFEYFEVYTCEDYECDEIKSLFLLSDTVYIQAYNIELADLTAILTLPDTSTQALTFTDNIAELQLTQTGTYSAEIMASKEGYQDYTSYIEFEVVDEISEVIDLTHICNPPDDYCGEDETYQNCPQDCNYLFEDELLDEIDDWIEDINILTVIWSGIRNLVI